MATGWARPDGRLRAALVALAAAMLLAAWGAVPTTGAVPATAAVPRAGVRPTVGEAPAAGARPAILRTEPGMAGAVAARLEALGASAVRALAALDLVTARLPGPVARAAAGLPGVLSSVADGRAAPLHAVDGYDPAEDANSLPAVVQAIGAREYYDRGYTGAGVDVALIDTGVAPVPGLDLPGTVVHGPDLSFASQSAATRFTDGYGHGTHMAAIVAGRDPGVGVPRAGEHHAFHGVAPGARVVSVRVGDGDGLTDVSQVLAAVDWVVQHRRSGGLDVRVLNLSFGTDSAQDPRVDPLAHAVEVAWRAGIVVVAAAGNAGGGAGGLTSPARDPFVLAVGAQDTRGTQGRGDDVIPSFSSSGDGRRDPDLVAPGVSIASLRAPGSTVDGAYPSARVGERLFRGSGTSQAAAVVSGAVALLLEQHPGLTPDQVKAMLTASAEPLPSADPVAQGAGSLDLGRLVTMRPPRDAWQPWEPSTGTGSLEAARGSLHLLGDGVTLEGERDIFGAAFDAPAHAALAEAERAWSDGHWNGGPWAGAGWDGATWASTPWTRSSWSRSSWSEGGWVRSSWSRSSWSEGGWR